jgi:hypothetical protein
VAERERAEFGADSGHGVAAPLNSGFKLIHRNYGNTLVRIGGQYFPRRTLIIAFSESVLLLASLLVATILRFVTFNAIQQFLADRHNWYRFIAVIVICQISLYYNDLYDLRSSRSRSVLLMRSLRAIGMALLALAMLFYLAPVFRLERGILG